MALKIRQLDAYFFFFFFAFFLAVFFLAVFFFVFFFFAISRPPCNKN
jgi:hypothetical protein